MAKVILEVDDLKGRSVRDLAVDSWKLIIVGNRRFVPCLGMILMNGFWYAFLLHGHVLPSVNSRRIVMCLLLCCHGQSGIKTARQRPY